MFIIIIHYCPGAPRSLKFSQSTLLSSNIIVKARYLVEARCLIKARYLLKAAYIIVRHVVARYLPVI